MMQHVVGQIQYKWYYIAFSHFPMADGLVSDLTDPLLYSNPANNY
jgi:hypothetical protein